MGKSLQQEWEDLLKSEGLAMSAGHANWLVFVDDTDPFQKERPRSIGVDGGLLSREYRLGDKKPTRDKESLRCQECRRDFVSDSERGFRPDFCSPACKQKAYRKRKALRLSPLDSEETVNAPAE